MRILLIGFGMYPQEVGGAQTHAFNVGKYLIQRGHQVDAIVLCHSQDKNTTKLEWEKQIQESGTQYRFYILDSAPTKSCLLSEFHQWLTNYITHNKPDIIHLFKIDEHRIPLFSLLAKTGIPQVYTGLGYSRFCSVGALWRRDHSICDGRASQGRCLACMIGGQKYADNMWIERMGNGVGRMINMLPVSLPRINSATNVVNKLKQWREFCRTANCVIAPSQAVERTFVINGFPNKKLVRLTYGVPDELYEQRKPKTNSNRLRISYLGKISTYKGIHIAIEAAKRAAKDGANFHLSIYGSLTPEQDPYHFSLYRTYNETTWPKEVTVEFCGRYEPEELPKILASTDIVIVPSLWPENATIVVLESLALGTPVLASDVEGIAEFINVDENGWLFPRGDIECLAKQLVLLSKSPSQIRTMSEQIQPILLMSKMVSHLEKIYSDVIMGQD